MQDSSQVQLCQQPLQPLNNQGHCQVSQIPQPIPQIPQVLPQIPQPMQQISQPMQQIPQPMPQIPQPVSQPDQEGQAAINGACHVSQIPPQPMAHPNQESVIPVRTSSSPNHLVATPQNKPGFLDSNTPQPSSVYSSYQQTMNANNTPQNKPGFLDSNTPQPSSVYSSYQQTMNVNNTWLSSSQASHVLQPQVLQNQASLEIAPARNPSGNQFANKSLQQYLDKPVHMQVREKAKRMVTTCD